jgi:protein involved in polysaccharide export with SLBB domain
MSLRNIKVFRKNDKLTDTLDVDLLTFYRLGKKDPFNPYLVEGDVIFVPPMKRNIDKIEVYGAVKSPLIYEYKKGDRLKDAIEMCYGFTDDADRTKIKITRFIDRLVTENLEVNYQLDGNMELASDDRIFVPRINNYHEKHHVTVEGEVLFPGVYPISEGITLLSFVLKQAGGFTDKSDLINAKVIRYQGEDRIDYEFQRIKAMIAVGSQLNEEEEEYFKLKSRQEPGLLAIDFRNVLEEGHSKQDILLKDNDRIVVPKISKTVTIIGAVIKPGIVEHVPGMDYSFYIEKSLGFTNKARTGRIQIIKQISGLWLDADTDIKIEVGDKIFVPEEPIRDYWEITKDIITVVSQVAAIFAIVWSVSR